MTTATHQGGIGGRLARAAVFGLLALAAATLQFSEARAQWATSGTTTSTTNTVGVGTAAPEQALHVNGPTEILSTGSGSGFKFRNRGSAASADDWVWYSVDNVARFWRAGTGDLFGVTPAGNFGIGTTSPASRLDVVGAANIWGGARYAVAQGFMAPGSLTVGNIGANFGGGSGWSANTAAILLEASSNTEIAVHDSGTRIAGLMHYEGDAANRLTIGRDMGWGAIGTVAINGNVGVGTAAPGYRLDVQGGAVNASGGLCMAGDCRSSWAQMGGGWTSSGSAASLANVAAGIWAGGQFAVPGGYMKPGSLTVGNTGASFGGGSGWNANTAGLMLETAANTEIVVHDGGTRIASLMQYEGDGANRITVGRDMAWGPISTIALNGNVGVGTNAPAAKLDVNGDIRASGNISAKYQDVAEWVPTTQKLAAGTVVVLDTAHSNHVLASTSAYDTRVAGVISAQPGISLGEAGEGKVLVATTGRVKVKVDATRLPIQIGDLIVTSDVAGLAMKSEPMQFAGRQLHAPGTIIGKALEPLAKGTGEILVLLSLQ
jgi:hypothetical protein